MRTQVTPLMKSEALTAALDSASGREVYVKLENLQPAGRFTSSQCCYLLQSNDEIFTPQKRCLTKRKDKQKSAQMRNVSSSFKIRGIGETMQKSAAKSFVGSSGGNAGHLYLAPFFICICICIFICMCRDGDGLGRQGAWCFSPPLCPSLHPW